ncbi:hypothetical protein PMIN01_03861 [Paraphaeosphaeria minitans]|uniref:Uncharacterized protein n=1 Tax=Paraphaeosphaeria minitans TaxID=565426 RepID=A0A9P6KT80_9PLEO|nr:hypothetical protein PMIN01_03861 [Paraphaeosphaeria minitans]
MSDYIMLPDQKGQGNHSDGDQVPSRPVPFRVATFFTCEVLPDRASSSQVCLTSSWGWSIHQDDVSKESTAFYAPRRPPKRCTYKTRAYGNLFDELHVLTLTALGDLEGATDLMGHCYLGAKAWARCPPIGPSPIPAMHPALPTSIHGYALMTWDLHSSTAATRSSLDIFFFASHELETQQPSRSWTFRIAFSPLTSLALEVTPGKPPSTCWSRFRTVAALWQHSGHRVGIRLEQSNRLRAPRALSHVHVRR